MIIYLFVLLGLLIQVQVIVFEVTELQEQQP